MLKTIIRKLKKKKKNPKVEMKRLQVGLDSGIK